MNPSFTLDTNCIIDLEQQRPDAPNVRALADAHSEGKAKVAVVAMSASENQKGGTVLTNFSEFTQLLERLHLDHLEILLPMGYFGISFWDRALFAGPEQEALEREIHTILFPKIEFTWQQFALKRALSVDGPPHKEWRNAKCDVQIMWAHINSNYDVLVTRDANFLDPSNVSRLKLLGLRDVKPPGKAALLIES